VTKMVVLLVILL